MQVPAGEACAIEQESTRHGMELWVLSDRQLDSIAEWQNAIDAEEHQCGQAGGHAAPLLNAGFARPQEGAGSCACHHPRMRMIQ